MLDDLDAEDLIQVLTEPKNSLIKQYKKLFEIEGVELEFDTKALLEIANKSMKRKTGARGLRSILEHILLDLMYELPSLEGVNKVIIDEAAVTGKSEPKLLYDESKNKKVG